MMIILYMDIERYIRSVYSRPPKTHQTKPLKHIHALPITTPFGDPFPHPCTNRFIIDSQGATNLHTKLH